MVGPCTFDYGGVVVMVVIVYADHFFFFFFATRLMIFCSFSLKHVCHHIFNRSCRFQDITGVKIGPAIYNFYFKSDFDSFLSFFRLFKKFSVCILFSNQILFWFCGFRDKSVWIQSQKGNNCNTMGTTCGAGTAYPYGAPDFKPGF